MENEIKRLHRVCNAKDKVIETLIEHLQYVVNITDESMITSQYLKQVEDIIKDAKNSLG